MNDVLLPAERRRKIREYLLTHDVVRTAELAKLLRTSLTTIRRDLEWLEKRGILMRSHGGAIPAQRMLEVPTFSNRTQTHVEEKHNIGRAAAALVEEGDTIFLNIGTTASQVARHLLNRVDLWNVTVITNNVFVTLELQNNNFEVVLLGGTVKPRSMATSGKMAIDGLHNTYASKAFIGVSSIHPKHGITQPYREEAEIDRLMIEYTRGPVILVADGSKWGVVSNYRIATLDQIDMLITDSNLPPGPQQELENHSVDTIIAGEDTV
jgi:DeoR/GlpR family transcriptional regulator of sugar metabolism